MRLLENKIVKGINNNSIYSIVYFSGKIQITQKQFRSKTSIPFSIQLMTAMVSQQTEDNNNILAIGIMGIIGIIINNILTNMKMINPSVQVIQISLFFSNTV